MASKLSKFYWQNSSGKKQFGLFNWKINNFRSIGAGDNSQSLELAPLTVICGENSSGKSTILNSILFITQMFSDNDDETHVNQQGSLINLGEFMEIVNETDSGVLDEQPSDGENQEPTREWLKNASDSFLQFSGSISIPKNDWQKNNLNEFSPSQIHFEVALSSLLEDNYDFNELKKLYDEYDFQGQKSKDKSRILRFNSDFVSYFTQDSGYYSYYDLPQQVEIPHEDDILEQGIWNVDKLSVVNRLVDFSKSQINYSNFENLKIERELKSKKYLFVDSEAERLFRLSSPEYEIKIGNNHGSLDQNYENFDSEELNKQKSESMDFTHGSCVPVLNNGLPKQPKVRTIALRTYLNEIAEIILGMVKFYSPSINEILNDLVGVTTSNDSYAPDSFWEDILSYNADEIFEYFLYSSPKYQAQKPNQKPKVTKQEIKNVSYWKWDSNPNEAIVFDRSVQTESGSETQQEYSFLAIEKLVDSSGKPLAINEVTSLFIEFIYEHIFQITKSVDGIDYFKFRSSGIDVPGSYFPA